MNAQRLVLVVDDNDGGRYAKVRILRRAGYEVLEAATGAAGLELLRERLPEIVLLDVMLPDMSGRSICAEIKSDPQTARTMVLQISALHVDSHQRVASLDAGADGYVVEPVEPEELVANVRALLRLRDSEDRLHEALDALLEADRRKDEFLAMLAHELRNPLAPVRNAVEILRRSDDRVVRERAREMVGRQVDHLTRLVDDLLDVARITTRKVALRRSIVPLSAILDSAIETVRPIFDSQRQSFVCSTLATDLWLEVDAVRMAQAIGNLLHNAAKFTPPEGTIKLEVVREGDELVIRVIDNGVGITPNVMASMFDLFIQGESSLDRAQGGLGIGLSLVKGLVELHGGRVTAASAGAGLGSAISIVLPLGALERPAPAREDRALTVQPRPCRILVVEDNVDAAESMQLLLESIGHRVTVKNNGLEALVAARLELPEVILLDIGLPGMDGYELARRLRAMPEAHGARLVAVSGYGQDKDRERSAQAGFDLHLVKPVDPARLSEAIATLDQPAGAAIGPHG